MENEKKLSFAQNFYGMQMVAARYAQFKELAEEQIRKYPDLTEDDYNDVVIALLVTKLLVEEGVLDEVFFESAIS